jgi:hypothetical protein
MGWLRKKAKQIGKGIKKIGSKIAGGIRKITRSKAFKIIAAIALATIVGPAAWATWGAGGTGTFAANLSAQTFAVTGGAFGTAAATSAAPAAVAGSTVAATPSAFASSLPSTAAAGTSTAMSAITPTATAFQTTLAAAPASTAAAPSIWSTVGNGISNFATKHPIITGTAASVAGGVVSGAINRALTPDQEVPGRMVGESAQERSQLAALQAGYQAQYGRNASQEMMLGMNFGYDSVGYQTTA